MVYSIIDEYLSSEAFVLLHKEATKELLESSGMPDGFIDPEELIDYINASLLLATGQTCHPILTPLESNNNV